MNKYESRQTVANAGFLSTFISTDKTVKAPKHALYRYFIMIFTHLLFVLSYVADIQILEGDITGSRIMGFHLADPFITTQIVLAHDSFPINLMIGSLTILAFYVIFAGRAFCSFVCPYNFLENLPKD